MKTALALILIAVTLATITSGCYSTADRKPLTENTSGGYLATPPHYQRQGGVLYAYDGANWYALQRPYTPNGAGGTGELWIRAGGSRVRGYYRTAQTFRDQSVQPVFLAY